MAAIVEFFSNEDKQGMAIACVFLLFFLFAKFANQVVFMRSKEITWRVC